MRRLQLTKSDNPATIRCMNSSAGKKRFGRGLRPFAALPLALMMGGCITVKAPDKPIVIELNINIKQEVIYRLAADAAQTIDKNAEIF
jgi:hypothetical protein